MQSKIVDTAIDRLIIEQPIWKYCGSGGSTGDIYYHIEKNRIFVINIRPFGGIYLSLSEKPESISYHTLCSIAVHYSNILYYESDIFNKNSIDKKLLKRTREQARIKSDIEYNEYCKKRDERFKKLLEE